MTAIVAMPDAEQPGSGGGWVPDALTQGLELYLVGGAVRDRLLGRAVTERDWVVVGSTPDAMVARGFRPVGRDFPVFLHPATGEEYALARTERKTGPGYRGFVVSADPEVTLEQDLQRRDLTVNAMAEDARGVVHDPYGGRADLAARRLRHVSDAFREDPVRILRLARFAARYAPLGFRPAAATLLLAREMVAAGEVDALVPERVWQEWSKALLEASPWVFVEVLRDCDALSRLLPELDRLFGIPQQMTHHPEIDSGIHSLLALRSACLLSDELPVRFAALVHDLGKGATPVNAWPRHPGHGQLGVDLIVAICDRYRVPTACRELATLASRYHLRIHQAEAAAPEDIVSLLESCDAFRRPDRFRQLLLVCEADARGCAGAADRNYTQAGFLITCVEATGGIGAGSLVGQLQGPAIAAGIRSLRVEAVREVIADRRPHRS